MKEISPFMQTALFNYSQFNTFDKFAQSGMLKYCLTNDLSEEILKKSVSQIIEDKKIQEVEDAKSDGWDIRRTVDSVDDGGDLTKSGRRASNIIVEIPIIEKSIHITVPITGKVGEDRRLYQVSDVTREPQNQYQNTRFNSRKPDTLFWSIFIAQYGVREFTEIGSKYMNREIEEKMRVMEFIKKNRPRMKSMKITAATGEEMMGDLLTNQSTSMLVLPALALFYETRIWIVSEETNTYLEYVPGTDTTDDAVRVDAVDSPASSPKTTGQSPSVFGSDTNYMIIYRATYNGRVSYTTETTEEPRNIIEKIQQTMIRIESIERPFKGISTYKLVDLEEIARKIKVQMPTGEKMKKNDWYVAISRHAQLGWLEPTRGRKPKDH